jgi:hypothetical protein
MDSLAAMKRPPRPPSLATRKQAFIQEILDEALADGLVVMCEGRDGDGPGFKLTPGGEAWLRDLPPDMLTCYPDRSCMPDGA